MNPLLETACLCVVSMIVVGPAASQKPVRRVNVRNGCKILQRLVELNFECRHFYIVFPLVGLSPFSAVATTSRGPCLADSTATTRTATVSDMFLVELAIPFTQFRKFGFKLLYVSGSVPDVS